jgi:hypothetical protein
MILGDMIPNWATRIGGGYLAIGAFCAATIPIIVVIEKAATHGPKLRSLFVRKRVLSALILVFGEFCTITGPLFSSLSICTFRHFPGKIGLFESLFLWTTLWLGFMNRVTFYRIHRRNRRIARHNLLVQSFKNVSDTFGDGTQPPHLPRVVASMHIFTGQVLDNIGLEIPWRAYEWYSAIAGFVVVVLSLYVALVL